jgi:colicin import membrane protein
MITAEFSARIKVHVERFWFRPRDARDRGLSTTLNITLDDAGNVTSVRVAKSSGDRGFDLSAVRAVRKASPLPVPSTADAMATFRAFNFRFCPTCRV